MQHMRFPLESAFAAALSFTCFVDAAFADRIVTIDGRVLEAKKAREKDGGYVLEFEHGVITLPDKKMVKTVEIEGDMSEYVPQNEDEKTKLAQGFVKYRGHWMSKPSYQDELRKEAEKSRVRADDLAAHADFTSAWTKESKHFQFVTNTSPELLNYYVELLEAYYDLMDNRFGIKPSPTLRRTKMTINIYKNRPEFHKLNAAQAGGGVAGYFWSYDQTLNFYHDYSEPSLTEWVALHECTHLLTYLIDPQYEAQIWLNEGVADYFGSSDVSRDKKGKFVIKPGKLQLDRVLTVQQAIKEGKDIKLDKLFTIERDSFHAFEYAHAWSFIYFLNESSPKYKKAFDKFFKDIYTLAKGIEFETKPGADKSGVSKQVSPAEIKRVVLASLGARDVVALDKEWKEFIAEIPLEGPEARFKRGYRAVMYGEMFRGKQEDYERNRDEALEDLNAAISGGIQDPRALAARSRIMVLTGKEDEAKADIEKAIALDPLNASYRWALGGTLYRGFLGLELEGIKITVSSDAPKPELTDEAKAAFGLATELAPESDNYRTEFARITSE